MGAWDVLGTTVLYRLTAVDAEKVNRRRTTGASIAERVKAALWPVGAQAHIGDPAEEGDIFPMLVVRAKDDSNGDVVSGQVFLPGNDVLWVERVNWSQHPIKPGAWGWLRGS